MNVFCATSGEVLDFLQRKNFRIFTTLMSEQSQILQNIDLQGNAALIFGTEHSGLSSFWQGKGENFLIPMCGTIDSLNLSNAVAVSCYEMLRQRQKILTVHRK